MTESFVVVDGEERPCSSGISTPVDDDTVKEDRSDDFSDEQYEPEGNILDCPIYIPSVCTPHSTQRLPDVVETPESCNHIDKECNAASDRSKTMQRLRRREAVNLGGVGFLLESLRNPQPKKRIVLGGKQDTTTRTPSVIAAHILASAMDELMTMNPVQQQQTLHEVRRLIRSKMYRCKRCKNRFIEKNLYERHLRDRHLRDYEDYLHEQEAEMEQQRQEELEANRIEELQTGGFIPPADDINADKFTVEVDAIPLPGELNGGVAPRFDTFGGLKSLRRPYRKKISPQCPFCDKRFRNEFSLKKHFVKKHPDYVEFVQCVKCFKCLKNNIELNTHICELAYICFQCSPIRNLCTELRLSNHRKKFHRGVNSGFRCNLCTLKFLTPRKLRKHKKMSHVFTKTFQCHFCDEIFISEVAVMTHERIHTGIIKFECKVCDFKCNRFVQMECHNKEEHGYICAICQDRLSEWSEMKNHTLSEHGGYLTSESNSGYIESPRVWVMFKGE
uniref:Zinc finger and BTB domain-containing protein 16 n=1 Tax=Ascaris suum TaxID=6253 RepID=F1L5C2_ASCSU